jgi:hypothetical protein
MDYTKLGNTGMKVSRICLGCTNDGRSIQRWPCVLMRCVWDDLASIAGVSTVLPKPFTIPVLLGTVQQHVRSRGDGSVMLLGAIGVAP